VPSRFSVPPCRLRRAWGFPQFSTARSNGTNKVIDTAYTFLLSSSVFPKLQPRSVPPSRFHIGERPDCSLTSYPKDSNGRLYPFSFQSLVIPSSPSSSNRTLRIPFISLSLRALSLATGGYTPSLHFSRPPLDSISSISRRPSLFLSIAYKMLLSQLLGFDNPPFSWGGGGIRNHER
jgi:hypothetical protein